jgi:uncharacterized repeat protein (TIGR03803 family)
LKNLLVIILLVGVTVSLKAQTNIIFTRLLSFDGTNGARPFAGLTIGNDGNLYGTTCSGGIYDRGTIFKMTPNGKLTMLFSFNGTNGFDPEGELAQGNDGNLYGTTRHGGNGYDTLHQFGAGTIFRINTDGKGFTNLYFFSLMGEPVGGLALGEEGNFYGVTQWGGKGSEGTIFRISPDGNFKTLISLDDKTGANPNSGLIFGRDGNLYGTMGFGGNFYTGDFFRLTTNGDFKILASFNETNNPRVSRSKLTQGADGDFYGTTQFGGAYDNRRVGDDDVGNGTVFKVATNGSVTTLASFNGWNGAHPRGVLVQANDGNFYGVTAHDMAEVIAQPQFNMTPTIPDADYTSGTIFKVTTNGIITKLFSFTGASFEYAMTNGYGPYGLVADSNGNFYGATILGGERAHMAGYASGTIFKFRVQTNSSSKK